MKGDVDSKLCYCVHVLKESIAPGSQDNYINILGYLFDIIQTESQRPEPYFYIGYMHEHGIF